MLTERHEELAALRALGLLEDRERRAFEAEFTSRTDLTAFAADLEHTAAQLAFTVPQYHAPAGLKERVLAGCTPSARSATVLPFPVARYAPWALAAGLALTAAWLAAHNLTLRAESDHLRTQQRLAEVAYESARNQLAERSLLAETMITELGTSLRRSEDLARLKVSALASLAGNTAEAQAIAVWDPAQQAGLLTFDKLPATADSQDYQIWVIDPAYANPVNGGVFHVAKDGRLALPFRPDQPVTQATAFAVSLEKKGGVPKAEGPIVLLGKVPAI